MPGLDRANPIFILGILPRSGTNFLFDLLSLHPECARGRVPINEDLFLHESDPLVAFIRAVRSRWDPIWGDVTDDLMDDFHAALGEGLISFLWVDRTRRLITKSPSVHNVDRFFALFPKARLVILVRDGRSVVQSCMATFGWHFERGARRWAEHAKEIRQFQTLARRRPDRCRIVRYEDLLDDLQSTLGPLLDFLQLDRSVYDFEAAVRLPVTGSSFYFGPGREAVHWEPVEKTAAFDPRARWRSWPQGRHERFEWIAGDLMRHFGYGELPEPARGLRAVKQRILDWRWAARVGARGRLGPATRPLRKRLGLVRAQP